MEIPDPEVRPGKPRRRFTVKYKLEVLSKADACQNGELSSMLRREGLYYSDLKRWRRQHGQGTLRSKKRGRKTKPVNPLQKRINRLEREKMNLEKKLRQAEKIIEFQKKIAELLVVEG